MARNWPSIFDIAPARAAGRYLFFLNNDTVVPPGSLVQLVQFLDEHSEAVAVGLERSGRIVTAAAVLFAVAIGAFATSQLVFIKELGLKGVSSQTQGDQLRVTGKKRDDLQEVIAKVKADDFGIPLQFNNFRD